MNPIAASNNAIDRSSLPHMLLTMDSISTADSSSMLSTTNFETKPLSLTFALNSLAAKVMS